MIFAITGHFSPDAKPDAPALQSELNEHLGQALIKVRLAGPLYNFDGKKTGFLVCLEADDFQSARAYLHESPYFKAGCYDRVEIAHFAVEVGAGQLR
ncbi:hypothetical protein BH09PSE3_BH09PSE3_15450 [soil metagenome]